jgi:hypothetical protein
VSIVALLLGVLLLLAGRTLYWAFVAVAGFLVGWELAGELLAEQPEAVRVLAAVVGGVIGALVGMLLQRVAFAVGGLFAGGYLGLALARGMELPGEPLVWFAVGAVLGAIVAAIVMDWAIIVLSSLAGAAAIVDQFDLSASAAGLLLVALAAVGIVVQGRRLRSLNVAERPTAEA